VLQLQQIPPLHINRNTGLGLLFTPNITYVGSLGPVENQLYPWVWWDFGPREWNSVVVKLGAYLGWLVLLPILLSQDGERDLCSGMSAPSSEKESSLFHKCLECEHIPLGGGQITILPGGPSWLLVSHLLTQVLFAQKAMAVQKCENINASLLADLYVLWHEHHQ
jgi:hypothetical protein